MRITELKINPDNPQKFDDLTKLENSIKEFPKMMELRPLVVDNNNMVLGGNKRLVCLQNLGYKEIPDTWIKHAKDLTKAEQKRFIIADNVGFGEWDWEVLNEWDEPLEDWGLELPKQKDEDIQGDIEFSDELLLEHNYVLFYFDNQYDWNVIIEKFGLKDVKSCIKTKPSQKVGIGRVVKGTNLLNII